MNSPEFDKLLSEHNNFVKNLHSVNKSTDINGPCRQAEKLNQIISGVNAIVEKDKPKALPIIKKSGNITIASNKSGIPLAKGRV